MSLFTLIGDIIDNIIVLGIYLIMAVDHTDYVQLKHIIEANKFIDFFLYKIRKLIFGLLLFLLVFIFAGNYTPENLLVSAFAIAFNLIYCLILPCLFFVTFNCWTGNILRYIEFHECIVNFLQVNWNFFYGLLFLLLVLDDAGDYIPQNLLVLASGFFIGYFLPRLFGYFIGNRQQHRMDERGRNRRNVPRFWLNLPRPENRNAHRP